MKTIFLYLPHPYLKSPMAQIPLGLLYLAAVLEQQKMNVDVKNFSNYSSDENAISDLPPADVYGITVTALELLQANRFAQKIKEKYPNSKVIFGGPGTISDNYVDWKYVDSILKGEGEITILTMLNDALLGNLKKIYIGEPVKDLDALPFPSRHLLKDNLGENIFAYNRNYKGEGSTTIVTSRGCPFNCTFCCASLLRGCGVRFRSPESVIEEIKYVRDTYNIHQFRISDEMFTAKKEHVKKICELIKPLNVIWRISTRVKPFSEEIAKMLLGAGCKEISFGIESFDNHVLEGLNKCATAEDNAKALEICRKVGLVTRALFMIRTPYQTKDTVAKNIEWLKKVPYDIIAVTSFVPLPGCFDTETEILTKDGWKFYNEISEEDLFLTRNSNGVIEYQKPNKIIKQQYSGEMISQEGKSINFKVTPNHKFLITTQYKNRDKFITADSIKVRNRSPLIGKWVGKKPNESIKIGRHTFQMKDWMAFLGIFISEGSVFKGKNWIYRVQIAQTKQHNVKKIEKLLERMGLKYFYNYNKTFLINSKDLYTELKPLGRSWEKYIPKKYKCLSKKYLEILYKWLLIGDGHSRIRVENEDNTYYTCSPKLRDDVLEILLKIGKCGNYYGRQPRKAVIRGREINSKRIQYVIQEKINKFVDLYPNNHPPIKENYNGIVWCVSVPNKIIYVRRNGKCYFSGNSDIWNNPDKHGIEILNKNLDDYNFYFYGSEGKNKLKDIIKIKNRSLEEFNEESEYFRKWIEEQGKVNRG